MSEPKDILRSAPFRTKVAAIRIAVLRETRDTTC